MIVTVIVLDILGLGYRDETEHESIEAAAEYAKPFADSHFLYVVLHFAPKFP